MKKLFAIIIAIMASFSSFAQIENVKISDQITINEIYAGTLSGTSFNVDSLTIGGFTSFRVGAMGTYKPAKWISFKTWGMIQAQADTSSWCLQQFWFNLSPVNRLSLEAGYMATLPTEQRPLPVTANGHFETGSEATIVGGAPTVKIKYWSADTNFKIGVGVALRNKLPEYSGMISIYKKITLSGWYGESNQRFGTALTLNFDRVYSTLVYKQDQILGEKPLKDKTLFNITTIQLNKGKTLALYSDVGYDFVTDKLVRGEWGLLKTFESKWVKGLIGLGYQQEIKSVVGYLFVHL